VDAIPVGGGAAEANAGIDRAPTESESDLSDG
jgi:hypothetical protein